MPREVLATLPRDGTALAAVRYAHVWDQERGIAAAGSRRLADYCSLGSRAVLLTAGDERECGTLPQASGGALALQCWGGRRRVSPAEYARAVLRLRPEAAVQLADEVGHTAGNNRTREAAERSLKWLEEIADVLIAASTMPADGGAGQPAAKMPRLELGGDAERGGAAQARAAPAAPRLLAHVPVLAGRAAVERVVAAVARVNARAAAAEAHHRGAEVAGGGGAAGAAPPPLVVGYALGGLGQGESAAARREALRGALALLPVEGVRVLLARSWAALPDLLDAVAAGVDVVDADLVSRTTAEGRVAQWDDAQLVAEAVAAQAQADVAAQVQADAAAQAAAQAQAEGAAQAAAQAQAEAAAQAAAQAAGAEVAADTMARTAAAAPAGSAAAPTSSPTAPASSPTALTARGASAPSPVPPALLAPSYALAPAALSVDPLPLRPGCDCFACAGAAPEAFVHWRMGRPAGNADDGAAPRPVVTAPSSRAYVRHLLQCQEMLGAVLLEAHNTHALTAAMTAVREAAIKAAL